MNKKNNLKLDTRPSLYFLNPANGSFNFSTNTKSVAEFGIDSGFDSNAIDNQYITGFCDGESSFSVTLLKDNTCKTGWRCQPRFTIELHSKELPLLQSIQSKLGVGNIIVNKRDTVAFRVGSLKPLTDVIIPHFTNYPLLTKKQADFLLFKSIIDLMNNKEHLTQEGLKKIASIRASINKGLNESLIKSFPGITPVERPVVKRVTNIDLC